MHTATRVSPFLVLGSLTVLVLAGCSAPPVAECGACSNATSGSADFVAQPSQGSGDSGCGACPDSDAEIAELTACSRAVYSFSIEGDVLQEKMPDGYSPRVGLAGYLLAVHVFDCDVLANAGQSSRGQLVLVAASVLPPGDRAREGFHDMFLFQAWSSNAMLAEAMDVGYADIGVNVLPEIGFSLSAGESAMEVRGVAPEGTIRTPSDFGIRYHVANAAPLDFSHENGRALSESVPVRADGHGTMVQESRTPTGVGQMQSVDEIMVEKGGGT